MNKFFYLVGIIFSKSTKTRNGIIIIVFLLMIIPLFPAIGAVRDSVIMPKLVIGIVVDQMKQDYLYQFYNKFSEHGFKRLMKKGFMLRNMHYNYIPTKTGPGHASVYTGTTPATHGIVGNEWYSRELHRIVNCVEDTAVTAIGGSLKGGDVSPRNLLSTTITDQLKLASHGRSKVIGISIKDRAAILPSGHMADAAYWFDTNTGNFMSSTFYMTDLPQWVKDFNAKKLPNIYLNQTWKTLFPIERYTESGPDDNKYENLLGDKRRPVFPYNLAEMRKQYVNDDLLLVTPFGNKILTDFSKAALEAEELGKDKITDFLTISFSSTDFIGHNFGPNSKEIEDTYLRLDRDLEDLFTYLDQHLGEGDYLLFLTADHAVVDVPKFLEENNMPGGYIRMSEIMSDLKKRLIGKYGPGDWIENNTDEIFLNHSLVAAKGLEIEEVQKVVANYLLNHKGIEEAVTASDLYHNEYIEGRKALLQLGYNPKRSGDVFFICESGFLTSTKETGANHGSGYTYDTHVPALLYGWGVRPGETFQYHEITDIAATVSMLLHIGLTSGESGRPISEIFEN